ncbi:erythrocyte band 7 integral membrane protein-like [Cimex lectularius]|uniref:Band 7 domain-containing protein n=1 Tax=Cimex lectularius TaxID=79782 RepID=A0A8I6S882_CIMLE|nr:erythrocyte band 7 integral membrane protein-like [Cimex lectularius]
MYHSLDLQEPTTHESNEASNPRLELALTILSYIFVILTFPLAILCVFQVVAEYERAIIFRLGKMREGGAIGPGLFFVMPCIDSVEIVDLRTVSMNIPEQEVITRDSCSVSVGAVVIYHIEHPLPATLRVSNYSEATRQLAASTLRTVLGQKSLSDVMSHRESIAQRMKEFLDKATETWGIKVERVEIKEIRLPPQMQKAMAAEAEAEREAKAKLIVAEGEILAAKNLKEASQELEEDPMALQLRYLQSLNSMVGENKQTVVFPVDLLQPLLK